MIRSSAKSSRVPARSSDRRAVWRRARLAATCLATAVAAACIQAPVEVETFDGRGDFSGAKTFAQLPPIDPMPRVGARVEQEIAKRLTARGFAQAKPNEADLLVRYGGSGVQRSRVRWIVDADSQYNKRENYLEGTLEIAVIEAASGLVAWRGVGRIDIQKEASAPAAAAKSVREILARFPATAGGES